MWGCGGVGVTCRLYIVCGWGEYTVHTHTCGHVYEIVKQHECIGRVFWSKHGGEDFQMSCKYTSYHMRPRPTQILFMTHTKCDIRYSSMYNVCYCINYRMCLFYVSISFGLIPQDIKIAPHCINVPGMSINLL